MNVRHRDEGLSEAWTKAYRFFQKKKLVRQVTFPTQYIWIVGAKRERGVDAVVSTVIASRIPNALEWMRSKGFSVDVTECCGNMSGEFVAFGHAVRTERVDDVARAIVMLSLDYCGLLKPERSN